MIQSPIQQNPQAPEMNPLAQLFHNIAPLNPKPPMPVQSAPATVKSDARLPIEVTASIQKLYAPPVPMNAKGNLGTDPTPGWGGKGR